ncbi:MAG: hypothetical protein J3K34DRAFT_401355 [Monoraphidium minutum]|nr:MAG: hypothetical protein J3K34DRAFT_401355 [Monoraphidium minutum]
MSSASSSSSTTTSRCTSRRPSCSHSSLTPSRESGSCRSTSRRSMSRVMSTRGIATCPKRSSSSPSPCTISTLSSRSAASGGGARTGGGAPARGMSIPSGSSSGEDVERQQLQRREARRGGRQQAHLLVGARAVPLQPRERGVGPRRDHAGEERALGFVAAVVLHKQLPQRGAAAAERQKNRD